MFHEHMTAWGLVLRELETVEILGQAEVQQLVVTLESEFWESFGVVEYPTWCAMSRLIQPDAVAQHRSFFYQREVYTLLSRGNGMIQECFHIFGHILRYWINIHYCRCKWFHLCLASILTDMHKNNHRGYCCSLVYIGINLVDTHLCHCNFFHPRRAHNRHSSYRLVHQVRGDIFGHIHRFYLHMCSLLPFQFGNRIYHHFQVETKDGTCSYTILECCGIHEHKDY